LQFRGCGGGGGGCPNYRERLDDAHNQLVYQSTKKVQFSAAPWYSQHASNDFGNVKFVTVAETVGSTTMLRMLTNIPAAT
jgi:hypothetical protein